MRILPLVAVLLFATPAFSQSRLYTNADLTPKPVTWTRTVTPEELRGLEARQFRLPILPDGPTVIFVSTREQPQPLTPYRPLQEPWSMTTYVGRGYGGYGGRSGRTHTTHNVAPGIHLRYP
jgi:hypothetical protein